MTMTRRSGKLLISPLLLILLALFVAPVLFMVPLSLQEYIPGMGPTDAWTLENYTQIFTDGYYREIIARTLWLGFGVTVCCLLLGYPLAYYMAHASARMRLLCTMLVIFPMLLNLVVRAFGWIALLADRGLINNMLMDLGVIETPIRMMFNLGGLLVGMTHIYLPFMILMLVPAIQAVPQDVRDAAATLSASRFKTFFLVTLPMTAPGILAGSIIVFVLSISALVTPRMLGGATYKVMATLIYDEFLLTLNWPSGAALAFVLTLIALLVITLSNRLINRWGGQA